MKHTTLTTTEESDGTHLQGYVNTTYGNLLEIFGEPTAFQSADGKVNCEWVIEFEDGLIATIYDWKEDEIPVDFYEWHIGGHTPEIVERVTKLFEVSVG